MKDIQKPAIPEWLPIQLDVVAVIEIYMYTPLFQGPIRLRCPTGTRLTVTGRPFPTNSAEIIKSMTLPSIKLFHTLLPIKHGFVFGRGRMLAMGV